MSDYNPVPDAITFLTPRTPPQRHAIARLLNTDGAALEVLRWIIDQPDCDLATAAMTFWRLRTLPPKTYGTADVDISLRNAALTTIAANTRAGRYTTTEIAWDGLEAWDLTPLIDAPPLDSATRDGTTQASATQHAATRATTTPAPTNIPAQLHGPFGTRHAEPTRRAFLTDTTGADFDTFDAMWRHSPTHVAVIDWLADKPANVWMAAIDDLRGGHNSDIYAWMLRRPHCPSSVAGQVFWLMEPAYAARCLLNGDTRRPEGADILDLVLKRWNARDLAPYDLDFRAYSDPAAYQAALEGRADPLAIPADLLDPPSARAREPLSLYDDFDYWYAITDLASSVRGPLSAARADWERSKQYVADQRRREREEAEAAARPPGTLERLLYGGKFTGAEAQTAHASKLFNQVAIAGALLVLAMWRLGAPAKLTFFVFLALLAVVTAFQAFAEIGGTRRIVAWWIAVFAVSMALALLFRWIDKGVIA